VNGYEIPSLDIGGHERERTGVIVTVREQTTGQLHTFHEVGQAKRAMLTVADLVDAMEGDWKIVALSTPTSIFRDLQGLRGELAASAIAPHRALSDPRTNEMMMLGLIGRMDLLQPLRSPGADLGAGRVG
jgi:hypothetical protein